jgi:hypothetical protein
MLCLTTHVTLPSATALLSHTGLDTTTWLNYTPVRFFTIKVTKSHPSAHLLHSCRSTTYTMTSQSLGETIISMAARVSALPQIRIPHDPKHGMCQSWVSSATLSYKLPLASRQFPETQVGKGQEGGTWQKSVGSFPHEDHRTDRASPPTSSSP